MLKRWTSVTFVALLGLAASARADVADLIGSPAPALRARPLHSDREVSLEAYRGRVVLLAFVATWCGACRRMAPTLDALLEAHREEGFEVLALSHEPRQRIRRHVGEESPAIPWLQCTGRTAVSYQADGLPTLVLLDREGRVRAAYQGANAEVEGELTRDVAALLRAP